WRSPVQGPCWAQEVQSAQSIWEHEGASGAASAAPASLGVDASPVDASLGLDASLVDASLADASVVDASLVPPSPGPASSLIGGPPLDEEPQPARSAARTSTHLSIEVRIVSLSSSPPRRHERLHRPVLADDPPAAFGRLASVADVEASEDALVDADERVALQRAESHDGRPQVAAGGGEGR